VTPHSETTASKDNRVPNKLQPHGDPLIRNPVQPRTHDVVADVFQVGIHKSSLLSKCFDHIDLIFGFSTHSKNMLIFQPS
jgi:hypothetical protein